MLKYKTIVYEGQSFHENFGWDFGNVILFQSNEYDLPSDAMEAFNNFTLPGKTWFAYMRVTENGKIVDEEMFDSSAIDPVD